MHRVCDIRSVYVGSGRVNTSVTAAPRHIMSRRFVPEWDLHVDQRYKMRNFVPLCRRTTGLNRISLKTEYQISSQQY
jgi:hypothetical protein